MGNIREIFKIWEILLRHRNMRLHIFLLRYLLSHIAIFFFIMYYFILQQLINRTN